MGPMEHATHLGQPPPAKQPGPAPPRPPPSPQRPPRWVHVPTPQFSADLRASLDALATRDGDFVNWAMFNEVPVRIMERRWGRAGRIYRAYYYNFNDLPPKAHPSPNPAPAGIFGVPEREDPMTASWQIWGGAPIRALDDKPVGFTGIGSVEGVAAAVHFHKHPTGRVLVYGPAGLGAEIPRAASAARRMGAKGAWIPWASGPVPVAVARLAARYTMDQLLVGVVIGVANGIGWYARDDRHGVRRYWFWQPLTVNPALSGLGAGEEPPPATGTDPLSTAAQAVVDSAGNDWCTAIARSGSAFYNAVHAFKVAYNQYQSSDGVDHGTPLAHNGKYDAATQAAIDSMLGGVIAPSACTGGGAPTPTPTPTPTPSPTAGGGSAWPWVLGGAGVLALGAVGFVAFHGPTRARAMHHAARIRHHAQRLRHRRMAATHH
jgi:hypothetical protein